MTEDLLEKVVRPGQYLGNEWGAVRKEWDANEVRLALAFPDMYELGMSNFGQRILYQIINRHEGFLADRTYAPGTDLEQLLRSGNISLWGWETRKPLSEFDLIGFSLQYELTYTNVLNMLDLSGISPLARERSDVFPLIFAGGPSAVNPEPMALFFDFFVIGDGEEALPSIMQIVQEHKRQAPGHNPRSLRRQLLIALARAVPGVYVPCLYEAGGDSVVPSPLSEFKAGSSSSIPERVLRQVQPLNEGNQPTEGIVPYLALVHDRQVLEVRRGCDRGCRFCQPGYTFLPVRERSTQELVALSERALDHSGHQEYSLLSLCVSDYTSLHETVRALNQQHMGRRASMSFPSQRADRMNMDLAEELKVVRKSGITLAPEAGTERLRQVINKGLNHEQIISAIEAAYQSGWQSVKLYFMCGLPTERDEDLGGIIEILQEASERCRELRRQEPLKYKRPIEFTCTISNFVPKPHTPFQWFGQISVEETARRHQVLRSKLKESGLRNVKLNLTDPEVSLLEAVISRGDRQVGELIFRAWKKGAKFDAWEESYRPEIWHESAREMALSLEELACRPREVGSDQPWDVVHVGLHKWWLVKEWEKAISEHETAPCTENLCHACGICTELDTHHQLDHPSQTVLRRNPFVKELSAQRDAADFHPSLFFMKPPESPANKVAAKLRFELCKTGDLRFISHLDLQHLLQRAARRANINIAYTEGFNPSPKLSLAISLPLFQEGLAEVGEIELSEELDAEQFVRRMNEKLPPEVNLKRAKVIAGKSASLSSLVGRAQYSARACGVAGGAPFGEQVLHRGMGNAADPSIWKEKTSQIRKRIFELLSKPTIEVAHVNDTRDGGTATSKDIRAGIYGLRLDKENPVTLSLELAAGSRLHIKPVDLLALLDPTLRWRVTRLALSTSEGISLFDAH